MIGWWGRQATPVKVLLVLALVAAAMLLLRHLPAANPIGPDRNQAGGHGL